MIYPTPDFHRQGFGDSMESLSMHMPPWDIVCEKFWEQLCSHPASQDLFALIDCLVVPGLCDFQFRGWVALTTRSTDLSEWRQSAPKPVTTWAGTATS